MKSDPDVLIVGLGPAGAAAARAVATTGRRVLAIDRKIRAGEPVQCAEFVPTMLSNSVGAIGAAGCQRILEMQTFVEDEAPDRQENFPGVMVDRAKFDRHLVEQASDAGAMCRFDTTLTRIGTDGRVQFNNGQSVNPKVIIGADGPRSRVATAIGAGKPDLVMARQITVPLCESHFATDIFLSADYQGGYAWLFPRGTVANLGLGVAPTVRDRLKPLLQNLHQSLVAEGRVGPEIVSTTGGAIPVGGMRKPNGRLERCLVFLCGDALGLTNPITGAGISSAVLSGTLAGECAANWLSGNEDAAADYAEELDDLFGAALARAVRRRKGILSSYNENSGPSRRDLRSGWIAYPDYWAA